MLAFIFVATMTSGLLVSLQSKTIDYDAVAYRTSVVLVEDPGEPSNWQTILLNSTAERDKVKRLGLAVERGYPGILKNNKIEKFFSPGTPPGCSSTDTLCYPEDYKDKLLIGDFPYRYNISLKRLNSPSVPETVGGDIPLNSNYGYIKRIVKIQEPGSDAVIIANTSGNKKIITIIFDFSELYNRSPLVQN